MKQTFKVVLIVLMLLPFAASAQWHVRDCFYIYPAQRWECHPYWILSSMQVGSWDDATHVADTEADAIMSQWRVDSLTVSAESEDESMGTVLGGGRYPLHSRVKLAAVGKADVQFVEWSDGVRDNPREFMLETDMTLTAQFHECTTVEQAAIATIGGEINLRGRRVYIKGAQGYQVYIYDEVGHTLYSERRESDKEKGYLLPDAGVYFIQVGASSAKKIVVK